MLEGQPLGIRIELFRNLTCKRVQVDDIWSFVYAKQKNVATAKSAPADAGDVWTPEEREQVTKDWQQVEMSP
jgi:hypothetical protein